MLLSDMSAHGRTGVRFPDAAVVTLLHLYHAVRSNASPSQPPSSSLLWMSRGGRVPDVETGNSGRDGNAVAGQLAAAAQQQPHAARPPVIARQTLQGHTISGGGGCACGVLTKRRSGAAGAARQHCYTFAGGGRARPPPARDVFSGGNKSDVGDQLSIVVLVVSQIGSCGRHWHPNAASVYHHDPAIGWSVELVRSRCGSFVSSRS